MPFRPRNGGVGTGMYSPLFCIAISTDLSYLKYLPILIDKVEAICEENGLRNDSIVMRMTGCPNGCARPYIAGLSWWLMSNL